MDADEARKLTNAARSDGGLYPATVKAIKEAAEEGFNFVRINQLDSEELAALSEKGFLVKTHKQKMNPHIYSPGYFTISW